MMWFQILASLFILFALNRIITRYREERIPRSEIIVWIVFWLIITLAVWWPRGTDIAAHLLGISRGYELVVAMSLAILFFLMFKVFSHIHQLQRQTTELVRRLAIEGHQKKETEANEKAEEKYEEES